MLRRTGLIAVGVVLLLIGPAAARTETSLPGTWLVAPGPFAAAPWHDGGHTFTISVSSKDEALPMMRTNVHFSDPNFFFCGATREHPDDFTGAHWYTLAYDWSGGGTLGGCATAPAQGAAFARGLRYLSLSAAGSGLHGNWEDGGASFPLDASPAAEGTTKTVTEPAPGKLKEIESPPLPAGGVDCGGSPGRNLAAKQVCSVTVDNAKGNDLLFEGSVAKGLANAIIMCWLLTDAGPRISSIELLKVCIKYVVTLFHEYATGSSVVLERSVRMTSTRSAGAGCRIQAIPIELRLRKGKVVSARKTKPRASPVKYGCSISGSSAKITVSASAGLRKIFGKHLSIGVYRPKSAPRRTSKLTFGYSWK